MLIIALNILTQQLHFVFFEYFILYFSSILFYIFRKFYLLLFNFNSCFSYLSPFYKDNIISSIKKGHTQPAQKPVKCDLTSQLIIYLIKYSAVREKLLCSRFPAAKIPDIRHVNVFDNPFTIGRDFLDVS